MLQLSNHSGCKRHSSARYLTIIDGQWSNFWEIKRLLEIRSLFIFKGVYYKNLTSPS